MEIIHGVREMSEASLALRRAGRGPALVPTMGWLHDGHLSLIRRARELRSAVVVSIFVNPTQFGPGEDFQRYPRDIARDARLAASAGAELIFNPSPEEIYPPGFQTFITVGELEKPLCGASRPGHFRGVATVVAKLLSIVDPEVALFGDKDWQQLQVIRRMVVDLNLPVEIVGCPTVREPDGVAMSSRNGYLSVEERLRARCLSRALSAGKAAIEGGQRDAGRVREMMEAIISAEPGAVVEYVSVAHPETLVEQQTISEPVVLLTAVRIGVARLIDNMAVTL